MASYANCAANILLVPSYLAATIGLWAQMPNLFRIGVAAIGLTTVLKVIGFAPHWGKHSLGSQRDLAPAKPGGPGRR